MMCFYGDTSIVGADVTTPWMEMIKAVNGGPALMALFSLVMGWTLVETATGCIHMIIDRFDVAMEEKGAAKLSDTNRGLITVITLIAALVLSRVGVVTLIEQDIADRNQAFGHNNVDRAPDLQHNLNHQNPPSKRNDLRVVCENQENVFTSQAHQHRHPDTRRNRNLQCRIHSFLYIIQPARSDQVAQHNLGCRRDRHRINIINIGKNRTISLGYSNQRSKGINNSPFYLL